MCFSLGFDNALRWVFNRSSLGFHKGPIHTFSQVFTGFHRFSQVFTGFHRFSQVFTSFHRFAAVSSLGFSNGFRWVFAMDSARFSAGFLEACSSMWIRRKIPIGRTSLENTM